MDRRSGTILDVRNLSTGYGGKPTVADIDLKMRPGDVLGLLGANGAGKSTFLKAVSGQLRVFGGTVMINGIDLAGEPVRAKSQFGLAIDAANLPSALSGQQYLELVASIRGCSSQQFPVAEPLERLALAPWLRRPIAEYSLGTRAKLSILAALLGSPPLLIFDESLNGLDPVSAWECKQMIRELAATGHHAIILSTHVVETVPALCSYAMFLADGHVVKCWNHQELCDANSSPGGFETCVMQALRVYHARSGRVGQPIGREK